MPVWNPDAPAPSGRRTERTEAAEIDGPANHRPEQASGTRFDQAHQPQRRVTGKGQPVPNSANPATVVFGVGNLERIKSIESNRAHPSKAHPRGLRLCQRPGDDVEQCLKRGRAKPTAQFPQRFFRHRRHHHAGTGQARAQLGPDPGVADPREQPEAITKYTPVREGSSRSRCCTVRVWARTSSTSSNGR